MIRHVFLAGDRAGRIGRPVGWGCLKVSARGQATTVGTLPVAMIEPAGGAALMTPARQAPLLCTRSQAAGGAAIVLPAITSATKKEARATVPSATKALPEGLLRTVCAH
jgi:hypothetical protein